MKKVHFFEKRTPKISPLPTYSIPFLSILVFYIKIQFRKRGQRSIVERNIGLEYALYNKAVNGTCSRDASRTVAISEIEFFVTIVNRGVLRIFTKTVRFLSYLQVSEKKHRKHFYILTHFCIFLIPSSLKWLNVTSILLTYASLRPR